MEAAQLVSVRSRVEPLRGHGVGGRRGGAPQPVPDVGRRARPIPAAAADRPGLRGGAARNARPCARPLRRRDRVGRAAPGRRPDRACAFRSRLRRSDRSRLRDRTASSRARAAQRNAARERIPRAEPARLDRGDGRGPRGHVFRDHALPRDLRALARRLRVLGATCAPRARRLPRRSGAFCRRRLPGADRAVPRRRGLRATARARRASSRIPTSSGRSSSPPS